MSKISKKFVEMRIREAATDNDNTGRSMTADALLKATECSDKLVQMFCKYIENYYPKTGRGSRLTEEHIELAYLKMYEACREFMDNDNEGELTWLKRRDG